MNTLNKTCARCEKEFNVIKRHAHKNFCSRKCQVAAWKNNNKEYCKSKDAQYYLANREKIQKRVVDWYSQNKDKVMAAHRRRYYKHREGLIEGNEKDVLLNLRRILRRRLNKALHSGAKVGSAVKDLGCSIEELKIYLEEQFQPGMAWNNYGDWHIDHIIPLATADLTNREEFLKVCHYTNLRPLWAAENCRVGYAIYRNEIDKKIKEINDAK